jgi:hypothetical protein
MTSTNQILTDRCKELEEKISGKIIQGSEEEGGNYGQKLSDLSR